MQASKAFETASEKAIATLWSSIARVATFRKKKKTGGQANAKSAARVSFSQGSARSVVHLTPEHFCCHVPCVLISSLLLYSELKLV